MKTISVIFVVLLLSAIAIGLNADLKRRGLHLINDGEVKIYRYTEGDGVHSTDIYFAKDKDGKIIPLKK